MPATPKRRLGVALCALVLLSLATAAPALADAQLVLTPSSWDAGSTPADTDGAAQTFTLANQGDQSAAPGAASIGGTDTDSFAITGDNCAAATLAPSDSCDVTVRFHPPFHAGSPSRSATLAFTGAPVAVQSATLTGHAQDPPQLAAQPSSLDFGVQAVNQGSTTRSTTIRNDGQSAIQVGNVWVDGPGGNAYWIQGTNCWSANLQPGDSCDVQVGFGPRDPVAYPATLHVSGPGSQADVALSGTGGAPQVVTDPSELDFGQVDVGGGSTLGLSLHNVGNAPFQIMVVLPSGGDVGAFRVLSEDCSLARLDPDGACSLAVRFIPLRTGEQAASLMVIGGNGEPMVIKVRGTGRQARVSVLPGSADYGRLAPGHVKTRSFRVVNQGNAPLRVSGVGVGGADAGSFAVLGETCTTGAVEPGAACGVRVRFAPQERGARSATLRVTANDAAGTTSVPLTGEGGLGRAPSARGARLSLQGRGGLPVPYAGGRADLGRASCATGPLCRVTITAAFLAGRSSAAATARRTMTVGSGTRLLVRLPTGRLGRPRTAVVRLRVSAPGYPTATQTLRAAVVPGRRVGSLVVADPPRRQSGPRVRMGTLWCSSARRACPVRLALVSRSGRGATLTSIRSKLSPDAVWDVAVGRGQAAGPVVVVVRSGRGAARLGVRLPGAPGSTQLR